MDKVLERHNQPTSTQENISTKWLNIYKMSEFVVKNLFKRKTSWPNDLTGAFCQTYKEEILPILCNVLQQLEEEKYFATYSESSIAWIAKQNKRAVFRKKKTLNNISHECKCKI